MNEKINRTIYIFGTGDNEITPNRLKGIGVFTKELWSESSAYYT